MQRLIRMLVISVLLTLGVGLVWSTVAGAADLGRGCCADLEERIAE